MSWVRVLVIATNVFREVIRDRVLYLIGLFAIVLLLVDRILVDVATIAANKIFLDFGLAAIAFLGLIITVFVGTNLINKEIEKRTVIVLLAKPVSRIELILGKHLGLCAVIAVLISILTVIYLGIIETTELSYSIGAILIANLFLILEFFLLTAVAIVFGVSTTSLLAILFTLAIYVMGHLSQDLVKLLNLTNNVRLHELARNLYLVLPDLSKLNLRNEAIYGTLPDSSTLLLNASYGVLYTIAFLIIAMLLFLQREF